jgi:hypothetical protein
MAQEGVGLEGKRGFDVSNPLSQKKMPSRASVVLNALVAQPSAQAQSGFLIPKHPLGGPSIDALRDYAPVAAFAGAFVGCLTTLDLTAFGMVPGIASALATALLCAQLLVTRAAKIFPDAFFPALYGGTFGGMTSVLWFTDGASGRSAIFLAALFISLSTVCGLAFFVVAKLDTRSPVPIASGYGGRSGTIATVASLLFVGSWRLLGADTRPFYDVGTGAFALGPCALELSACMAGIFATLFVLRHHRVTTARAADRVFIASVVALIGLMTLHLSSPNDTHTLDGFYAGCFLGMSTSERLKGWFQPVFGGVVLAAVLILVRGFLPGVGGGLGFAAFVTVAMLVALNRVAILIRRSDSPEALALHRDLRPPRQRGEPPTPQSPERPGLNLLSGLWGSSMLEVLARLGTTMANAGVAAFLVIGWLPHWNATILDRLLEAIPGAVGTAAEAAVGGQSATTMPQLAITEGAPRPADDPIPLGIALLNADDGDAVVLGELPPGSGVTSGRPLTGGGWHLFAHELASAAIRPAVGFIGQVDITAELQRADRTVDRRALHFQWTGIPSRATAEVTAPPIIGATAGRPLAEEPAENHEAMFREFLQWTTSHPVKHAGHAANGRHPQ